MRSCPLCNTNQFHKIIDLNYALFDDLKLSGEMQLVQCLNCHMQFNNTSLTDNDFASYYRSNEYYSSSRSAGSGGSTENDRRRYNRIYDTIKPYLSKDNSTIVDLGCGKGGMLHWLQQNTGVIPLGVETSLKSREFAKENFSLSVSDSIDVIDKPIDCFIISHVFEHVFSPNLLLNNLLKFSHKNSIFYIEVPLAEDYLTPPIKWHELYFEHINHFSKPDLTRLIDSNNLSILEMASVNFYQHRSDSSMCQFVIAAPKNIEKKTYDLPLAFYSIPMPQQPAFDIISGIIEKNISISIWGVSQYTQMIIGSYPLLQNNIKYLFDASIAKIGRTIKGIPVISSENLAVLGPEDVLLIPTSPYCNEMENHLAQIGFSGKTIRF